MTTALATGAITRSGIGSDVGLCAAIAPHWGYACTEAEGHERGDIPHVSHGIRRGEFYIIAIWDNSGRYVDIDEHGAGVTL